LNFITVSNKYQLNEQPTRTTYIMLPLIPPLHI